MGRLPIQRHPDLLVGADALDDAGVFRIAPDLALVQTVDFFPPLVDDPYDFGRIAAANALSDAYAMGAEPLTALNIVGFPDKELPPETLTEILRGGAEKVAEAGAVTVGGHSVRDVEVKYGLAVTARVHPDGVLSTAGARPGDRLVLTKPLGSGVLTSAAKAGKLPEAALRPCIEVMAALNRPGATAARRVGVRAATDITGFGLLGHSANLARASGVQLRIDSAAIPLMDRVLEFARAGVLTRAYRETRAYLGAGLEIAAAVEPALAGALLDAQTSGGLLLSVPAEKLSDLLAELVAEGALCAAVIGEAVAAAGPADVVVH